MSISQIAVIGGFVAFLSAIVAIVSGHSVGRRHRERTQRLQVLENALQHPDLDSETRRQILQVLTREQGGLWRWISNPEAWSKLWFGTGWLLFIIGGGVLLLDLIGIVRRIDYESMSAMTLVGLAMMSLPFGLRELRRRDLADQR